MKLKLTEKLITQQFM